MDHCLFKISHTVNWHSQWIRLESFYNVIIQAALTCFKGHGAVKLAGHRCTCQRFFSMLPQEQCHLLPLLKDCPHKQVVEVERNQQWSIIKAWTRHIPTGTGWHILLLEEKVRCMKKNKGQGNEKTIDGNVRFFVIKQIEKLETVNLNLKKITLNQPCVCKAGRS